MPRRCSQRPVLVFENDIWRCSDRSRKRPSYSPIISAINERGKGEVRGEAARWLQQGFLPHCRLELPSPREMSQSAHVCHYRTHVRRPQSATKYRIGGVIHGLARPYDYAGAASRAYLRRFIRGVEATFFPGTRSRSRNRRVSRTNCRELGARLWANAGRLLTTGTNEMRLSLLYSHRFY